MNKLHPTSNRHWRWGRDYSGWNNQQPHWARQENGRNDVSEQRRLISQSETGLDPNSPDYYDQLWEKEHGQISNSYYGQDESK